MPFLHSKLPTPNQQPITQKSDIPPLPIYMGKFQYYINKTPYQTVYRGGENAEGWEVSTPNKYSPIANYHAVSNTKKQSYLTNKNNTITNIYKTSSLALNTHIIHPFTHLFFILRSKL